MAKRNSPYTVSVSYDFDNETVTIIQQKKVEGGDNEEIGRETFSHRDLPENMALRTSLYGDAKILQDRTSAESMSSDRLTAMKEVWDRLREGHWEKERAVGARLVRVEVEALARIQNASVSAVQKELNRMDEATKEALFDLDAVKEIAAEILAEREEEGSAPDLAAMLAA